MSDSVRAFVVALAIGLVLLIAAAVHDRRQRLRAERIEIAPAEPPSDLPAPPSPGRRYVRRTAAPFTQEERNNVEEWQQGESTEHIDARLADAALATHLGPETCILHNALVLVCDDRISDVREVLATAKRALDADRSLLLVAPSCAAGVIELFSVNLHAGSLASCVALADAPARARVCELTGARAVSASDLRSDDVPPAALGRARRLVCDAGGLWLGSADT